MYISIMEEMPKKTADKTTYMREYKRKAYQTKGDEIKEKNKAYYYKYKLGGSTEDMKKYDTHLPSVLKIRKEIEKLRELKPDIIKEVLSPYFSVDETLTV